MKFDDISWHTGGSFPVDLVNDNAATHIGMFLAWAFSKDLIGDLHVEESEDALTRLQKRRITGAQFLLSQCDGKLTSNDLSDVGTAFAKAYYDESYLDDYLVIVPDAYESLYHLEDTWENFDKLKPMLDKRFKKWSQREQ